jgi:hypothetical protein
VRDECNATMMTALCRVVDMIRSARESSSCVTVSCFESVKNPSRCVSRFGFGLPEPPALALCVCLFHSDRKLYWYNETDYYCWHNFKWWMKKKTSKHKHTLSFYETPHEDSNLGHLQNTLCYETKPICYSYCLMGLIFRALMKKL